MNDRTTYSNRTKFGGEDAEIVLTDGENVYHVGVLVLDDIGGEILT